MGKNDNAHDAFDAAPVDIGGWNYRMMYVVDESGDKLYYMHEVIYNKQAEVRGWTGPIEPFATEGAEEMISCLNLMIKGAEKEPLHYYHETPGDADYGGKYWGVKHDAATGEGRRNET